MTTPENLPNLVFGDFMIIRSDERLVGPDGPVKIGHPAFRLLLKLLDARGQLVRKDELLASVWPDTMVSEGSLTTAIRELRLLLGDDARTPRYIESVYGRGYRFIAPAVAAAGETAPRRPPPNRRQPRSGKLGFAVLLAPLLVGGSSTAPAAHDELAAHPCRAASATHPLAPHAPCPASSGQTHEHDHSHR